MNTHTHTPVVSAEEAVTLANQWAPLLNDLFLALNIKESSVTKGEDDVHAVVHFPSPPLPLHFLTRFLHY